MRIDIDNPTVLAMIEDIKNNTGAANNTEVVRAAVNYYYRKMFPLYSGPRPDPAAATSAKAAKKENDRDSDRVAKLRDGKTMCEELGGKSIQLPDGAWVCKYNTFDKLNKHEVSVGTAEIPLLALNGTHLELQYKNGTREEINEILAKKGK